jgi:fibronectin type 3 domain-containing protein
VQFEPTSTGAATGQLTIKSNSTTNSTAAIALTGTGTAASYSVDLGWDAPVDSAVPIAGYNVYRAVSGSSSYALLNTALDTQTTYVDSAVQTGMSYDYMIESVDTSGVASAPTSPILVAVP